MARTAEQIEAEIAQLDERIAQAGDAPTHQNDVLQLRQAQQRREMLWAELRRFTQSRNEAEVKSNQRSNADET